MDFRVIYLNLKKVEVNYYSPRISQYNFTATEKRLITRKYNQLIKYASDSFIQKENSGNIKIEKLKSIKKEWNELRSKQYFIIQELEKIIYDNIYLFIKSPSNIHFNFRTTFNKGSHIGTTDFHLNIEEAPQELLDLGDKYIDNINKMRVLQNQFDEVNSDLFSDILDGALQDFRPNTDLVKSACKK